uniref:THH1/TOM1/TOM3 domain-containing protein n=1 Tax=Alexandrium monilatum TaxID=311494 RepID=A0A7S4QB03_9DINO
MLAWLEGLGVLLFGTAALLSAHFLACVGRPSAASASPANTGKRMRRRLLMWLAAASTARILSLIADLGLQEGVSSGVLDDWEPAQQRWLGDLVALLPALVFLSAFSLVVLFWAQLHYTVTIVPLPLLDCQFLCINVACYVLVAAIAVGTLLLRAYGRLWTYLTFVLGLLNAAAALSFLYYGLMVVLELRGTSRERLPELRLSERVVALLVVCPAALLLRGGCYLAWGLSLARPSRPADLLLCLLGEWLPSMTALAVLSGALHKGGGGPAGGPADALNDSTDSEPLLHDDATPAPRSAGLETPGLTWKQLHPQPAAGP